MSADDRRAGAAKPDGWAVARWWLTRRFLLVVPPLAYLLATEPLVRLASPGAGRTALQVIRIAILVAWYVAVLVVYHRRFRRLIRGPGGPGRPA